MEIEIKSKYNNYVNHLQIFPCSIASNIVFVNIHGAFGESGDEGSKSQKLGEIISSSLAHVVHISTSRNWELYNKRPKYSQSLAFPGKTFDEEKNDIADSLDYILKNVVKLYGISDTVLYLVANSWGGTVISSLISEYSEIVKLVICNSGIKSLSVEHQIFTTVPKANEILRSTVGYKCKLLFLQSALDEVVPVRFQDDLFESYKNADKTKIIIPGANHNFSSLFGKDKELANKVYIDEVLDFFI